MWWWAENSCGASRLTQVPFGETWAIPFPSLGLKCKVGRGQQWEVGRSLTESCVSVPHAHTPPQAESSELLQARHQPTFLRSAPESRLHRSPLKTQIHFLPPFCSSPTSGFSARPPLPLAGLPGLPGPAAQFCFPLLSSLLPHLFPCSLPSGVSKCLIFPASGPLYLLAPCTNQSLQATLSENLPHLPPKPAPWSLALRAAHSFLSSMQGFEDLEYFLHTWLSSVPKVPDQAADPCCPSLCPQPQPGIWHTGCAEW